MYKKMMMIAGFCLIAMLTGCDMLESYDLPKDHKVIKNVELSNIDQVRVEYYDLWTEGFWDTGIDMGAGKVISENDSHGGFHGDGLYLSEIKFSDNSTLERIKTNTKWHELPLSKNLNEFIYEPLDDGIKIPKITNGYYYFYDRHSESSNPYDDTELLSRGSYNFTVMIYDCDTDTLYVCREDT